MAPRICPICEIEFAHDHNCLDYDFSKFSIELELLDLPFDLEPYGPVEEPVIAAVAAEEVPERRKRNYEGFSLKSKPAPLFLRL